MRSFGRFSSGGENFFGEVREEQVHRLTNAPWLEGAPAGNPMALRELRLEVPVAPSKVIAVGLNYADHIAERKRTPLGTPLIWFKASTSLLPHEGTIEIAFPEH
ncbi:MAG: Rv2993c-like domain-containing protein [Chthoniobacterales bacterium]